jgi:hypothetical protein
MKKIIFTLFLVLFFLPDNSSSQISYYNVTMAPTAYDSLYLQDPYSTTYYNCIFEYSGNYWNDATIRFKGATTRLYPKKGFRIKFSTADFYGMKSFKLNPMFTDKSFIREKLCWDLFKRVNSVAPDALYYVSF